MTPTHAAGRDERRPTLSREVLRSTHPFSVVRRHGRIVGCWYTTCARVSKDRPEDATGPVIRLDYRGMMRTADDRVVGTYGSTTLTEDIDSVMLQTLRDASHGTADWAREAAAQDFVDGVRDAVQLVRSAWDGEREEVALMDASDLDGHRSWRHDDARSETIAALRSLHVARNRVIGRFLDTLDPILVEAMRGCRDVAREFDHRRRLGQTWPLLDETFGRGAPLRSLVVPVIADERMVEWILGPYLSEKGTTAHLAAVFGRQDAGGRRGGPGEPRRPALLGIAPAVATDPCDRDPDPAYFDRMT